MLYEYDTHPYIFFKFGGDIRNERIVVNILKIDFGHMRLIGLRN